MFESLTFTQMPPHARKAKNPSKWPWPYAVLSDGTELELDEHLPVRSLVSIKEKCRNNKEITLEVGELCSIIVKPLGFFSLIKYGRGNTRYYEMKYDAREGIDFEIIPQQKITVVNAEARSV